MNESGTPTPQTRERPAYADSLPETLAHALRLLSRGVADRRSVFHTPSLATTDAAGVASVRTVVLRGFDPATRILRFHSDRRAAKLRHIAADPRVSVHVYDPHAAIQLRLSGTARMHCDDAVADAAWERSSAMGRAVYGVTPAPGDPIDAPDAVAHDDGIGRAQFAVVEMRMAGLEWLWLQARGHRRARFSWDRDGDLASEWLVP